MKTLTIDNRDLAYTIDTYGMFTGDSSQESEAEYLMEEYKLTEDEWRTIGFDYDHPAIVKSFATESIGILENALQFEKPKIVHGIELEKSNSPRFYNYTTDYYVADWKVDTDELDKYIASHQAEYVEWKKESGWGSEIEQLYWNGEKNNDYKPESAQIAQLDFYLQQVISVDEYNESMWERESEVYCEHMTPDSDTAKLIATKEVKK